MAKRANPFIDDYVQQSKVHIGLKQFNNNEERLQKVYEKTLQKLFKGQRKAQQNGVKCSLENNYKKDGLKQLFIGANGILVHAGQMVKGNSSDALCKCGEAKIELCAYCDMALCVFCKLVCSLCQHNFCSKCSLYGSEDSAVCVSCYR
ncbi:uncharacterized protein LOC110991792 [Pieris rapae]|uniref:uncharacterized protein LOC110991792 n=1 Tax=Pieris rapae TaxID=64459 RepID=UPI000B925613|nr:uncharacterized protein LOC110991792 [Pieris rapae]